ncbi:F-box protein CPR1-like [Papaver somniferum]|uniref:F-box protein CPR1-like n=1 Tax=Papaver somniferum TaxID=3469 RepID=UPI000E703925|nr:F-box protein CPR1-like [Papaver somniferum]
MNYDPLSSSLSASRCEIHYPFETKGKVEILGSSNGLLCIHVGEYFDESTICIWNPTTKEYKRVPKSPNGQFPSDLIMHDFMNAFGFCYDCRIDDYKFIKVVGFIGVPSRSGVQVYKLGSDSWSIHRFIPYYFPCNTRRSGISVHESLHWLARPGVESYLQESPDVIVSFNICEERFDALAFPASVENENVIKEQELGALDGCLCLLLQNPDCRVDLWVMREYGVRGSWSILFRTTHDLVVNHHIRSNFLVYSFENGEVLLANFDSFILYNPRCDRAKTVTIPGIRGSGEVESSETRSYLATNLSLLEENSLILPTSSGKLAASRKHHLWAMGVPA